MSFAVQLWFCRVACIVTIHMNRVIHMIRDLVQYDM